MEAVGASWKRTSVIESESDQTDASVFSLELAREMRRKAGNLTVVGVVVAVEEEWDG